MPGGAENVIKQKLGIKWIDAKRLAQEAQSNLGLEQGPANNDEEADIVEEALDIFEELTPKEQNEMRIPEADKEPEWKRKAREQAEKREREWEEEEERRKREQMAQIPATSSPEVVVAASTPPSTSTPGNGNRVIRVTHVEESAKRKVDLPPNTTKVTTRTIMCVVM